MAPIFSIVDGELITQRDVRRLRYYQHGVEARNVSVDRQHPWIAYLGMHLLSALVGGSPRLVRPQVGVLWRWDLEYGQRMATS
jgi:hypothetical protein